MNEDVVRKHLVSIEATFELLRVQVAALRHELGIEATPKARVSLPERPERCKGVDEAMCGVRNADARVSRSNFTEPHSWMCMGCRAVVNPDQVQASASSALPN